MTYPTTAPASGAYPLSTSWGATGTFANTDQDNTNGTANYAWGSADSQAVGARVATTGAETYTVTSGSVVTITGTTIDGVSVAVNDVVLVKDAPASSGTGSVGSSQPANGVYYVTAVASNISVSRAATMSSTSSITNPAARMAYVRAGTLYAVTQWYVAAPSADAAFTYGTTAMQWKQWFNNLTSAQAGINNFNTALQSQTVVSGTAYYITSSNLLMPAAPIVGMAANQTTFVWDVAMAKTAAGTGTFAIVLYRGTTGTTADTADITQTLGTQTAVADNLDLRVKLTVTATGATGSYFWSICPSNSAGAAAGFGIPSSVGYFSGSKTTVALNTTSLQFGLGFIATTGTPTVTVPMVRALAYDMN